MLGRWGQGGHRPAGKCCEIDKGLRKEGSGAVTGAALPAFPLCLECAPLLCGGPLSAAPAESPRQHSPFH